MKDDKASHMKAARGLTYFPRLSGSENHRGFIVADRESGVHIADVIPIDEDGKEGEVYAKLFAASPKLVKVLKQLVDEGWVARGAVEEALNEAGF